VGFAVSIRSLVKITGMIYFDHGSNNFDRGDRA
jgi:hypothetical protein